MDNDYSKRIANVYSLENRRISLAYEIPKRALTRRSTAYARSTIVYWELIDRAGHAVELRIQLCTIKSIWFD